MSRMGLYVVVIVVPLRHHHAACMRAMPLHAVQGHAVADQRKFLASSASITNVCRCTVTTCHVGLGRGPKYYSLFIIMLLHVNIVDIVEPSECPPGDPNAVNGQDLQNHQFPFPFHDPRLPGIKAGHLVDRSYTSSLCNIVCRWRMSVGCNCSY